MTNPARGGVILVGRLATMTAINYGFGVALAWLLSPADFGRAGVIQAVLLTLAMVTYSGFPWMVTFTLSSGAGPESVGRVLTASLTGNFALGCFLALAVFVADRTGLLRLGSATVVLTVCLTIPLFALHAVFRGALHGSKLFGKLAIAQMAEVCSKVAVALVLILGFHLGVEAVTTGFLVGAAIAVAFASMWSRNLFPPQFTTVPLATYTQTLPLSALTISLAFFATIDFLMLKALGSRFGVPPDSFALYQVGIMLSRAPYLIGDALMDAAFPYMARRHASPDLSHSWLNAAGRWVALFVLPLAVLLVISPRPVIALFFPDTYGRAGTLIRVLASGTVGAIATVVFAKGLQATRRIGEASVGTTIGLAAEVGLLLLLIPKHGAMGAAIASSVSAWISALMLASIYYRKHRVRLPQRRYLVRYLVALAVMLPFLFIAQESGTVAGIAWIGIGGIAYLASLNTMRLVRIDDIRRVAADVLGREHEDVP